MKDKQKRKLIEYGEYQIRNCIIDAENIFDYIDNMKKELQYAIERLKRLQDDITKLKGD